MTTQMMSQLVLPQAFFERKPLVTAEGETLTLEDRFQMMELIHRFEWSYGALNQEAVFDLLTDDIIIDHAMGYAQGKAEMVALGVPSYGLRHMFANHVLFVDEQGCPSIVAHMLVIQVVSEQPLPVAFPAVLDQGMNRYIFRKEDGHWKICKMIFEQQKLADYVGLPAIQRSMAQTASERAKEQGHI
jgi:SnoaL-like domain